MSLWIQGDLGRDAREALRQEWLDTNGIGGYASSTILHCHTRKYHGLLVANLKEPAGRFVLLSKFEDSIVGTDREFFLSCHKYPGTLYPREPLTLAEFRQDEYPRFTYRIGDVLLHKSIMMVSGSNTVLIRYDLDAKCPPLILRLKPLLAYRNFHDLTHDNIFLRVRTYSWGIQNGFKISPYEGMPDLFIQTSVRSEFLPSPSWYRNFEYVVEAERGYPSQEDLFLPGVFEIPLPSHASVIIAAGLEENTGSIEKEWDRELVQRRKITHRIAAMVPRKGSKEIQQARRRLLRSAEDFLIVTPEDRPAIIAGYHWFGDWGRDTLIALPGLTFCRGRPATGLAILESFAQHEHNGLLPNMFGAGARNNAYNSVDAALWFFWATQQMVRYTGDVEPVRPVLWPTMKKILRVFMEGTDYEIYMNPNGLLHAGNRLMALTWMDAIVSGVPATPRHGYPVEINALWYNAMAFTCELADRLREPIHPFDTLLPVIRNAFLKTFWIAGESYLGDVFTDEGLDPSVRPNQIFAVSLPYTPLDAEQQTGVVDKVTRELLTPYGVRTLSPRHSQYRGHYGGTPEARDAAYHQGTVWPWLLGHYGEAYLKVAPNRQQACDFLLSTISPLLFEHIQAFGLGHISEVFDGDPPHRPNGTVAQAWNTAELIRLLCLLNEPKKPHGKKQAVRGRRTK